MSKRRLLDLFCGAGGAAAGYARAGFEVVGVDSKPQPHYPFEFVQGDALEFIAALFEGYGPDLLSDFDAIHASPPCQNKSSLRSLWPDRDYPELIPPTQEALRAIGKPYVIENVAGARAVLSNPICLCGSSFGLDVRRHRYFETNWPLFSVPCAHHLHTPRFRSLDRRQKTLAGAVGVHGSTNFKGDFALRCKAMGIDWMTNAEITQAIPSAMTEYIGNHLLAAIESRTAVIGR